MIEYKEVEEINVRKITKSITCDKCGRKYAADDLVSKEMLEAQEFCYIRFTGGYGSIFGDGTEVECDICQHCLKEMIGDICRTENDLFN